MKRFKNRAEFLNGYLKGDVAVCVAKEIASVLRQMFDEDAPGTAQHLTHAQVVDALSDNELTEMVDDFDQLFGGNVFIVEAEWDLRMITGVNGKPVIDDVNSWDLANYCLQDKTTGWFEFFNANNNGGGPSYFVPERFWTKARVEEHREATLVEMLA